MRPDTAKRIQKRSWLVAKKDKSLFWSFLIVVPLVAGCISLAIGLKQSVWFDEAYSILVAKQSIAEIIRLSALDTHPPLYYILLKMWATIFGWNDIALRSFSALCLAGSIFFAGLLARRMFGVRVALGMLLLLMISPLLLRYGFEIRMYALGSLLGMAATYVLYVTVTSKQYLNYGLLITYGVLIAIGTYTLYYLVLLWFAHIAWLFYIKVLQGKSLSWLKQYVAAFILSVVLFSPWLPSFVTQTTNGALAPIGRPLNLEQLIGIVSFNFLYQPLYMLGMFFTFAMLIGIASVIMLISESREVFKSNKVALSLLILYVTVPIVIVMLISFFRSMYVERYLAHIAIGGMMLVGVVAMLRYTKGAYTRRAIGATTAIFGITIIGVFQLLSTGNFNFQRLEKPQVADAAAVVTACSDSNRLIVNDPYIAIEMSYYLSDCPIYFVSEYDELGGGYAPLSGSQYQIKSFDKISDAVFTYMYYGEPSAVLNQDYVPIEVNNFGILHVATYKSTDTSNGTY